MHWSSTLGWRCLLLGALLGGCFLFLFGPALADLLLGFKSLHGGDNTRLHVNLGLVNIQGYIFIQ